MQNMTKSPRKSKLNISKHSKKFSFRLEKYNNTLTVFKQSIFIRNKLVLVNFKVVHISIRGQIQAKFYPLDFTHFGFFPDFHLEKPGN